VNPAPFSVGDVVVQRHQRYAGQRLVVRLTDDPDIVVVFDSSDQKFRRVHAWAHDLVSAATDASRAEAVDHTLSEAYARTTSRKHW
jgi:hypothetical protein